MQPLNSQIYVVQLTKSRRHFQSFVMCRPMKIRNLFAILVSSIKLIKRRRRSLNVYSQVLALMALATAESHKVVIVGAGLAGVSAAAKLIENGVDDVVILEAEDRMGGRIHSIPFSNGTIDLGAQWCHGEKDNAVYEMVHDHYAFGSLAAKEKPINFLLTNGQRADTETCSKLYKLLENLSEASFETVKNESLGTFVEREYRKALESPEYEGIDKILIDQMLINFDKQMTAYYAAQSWLDISMHYGQFAQECEGNTLLTWNRDGFKTVFDYITVKVSYQRDMTLR